MQTKLLRIQLCMSPQNMKQTKNPFYDKSVSTYYYVLLFFSGSRGDFEKVQSGGRNIDDSNKVNQQLSLGNRYSSLQD